MTDKDQLTKCNQLRLEQSKEIDDLEEYIETVESRFLLWRFVTICLAGAIIIYKLTEWGLS